MAELYPSEVLKFYKVAPKGVKQDITHYLLETLGDEYQKYKEAYKLGFTAPIERCTYFLYAGVASLYNDEKSSDFRNNKLVFNLYNKIKNTESPNVYIRVCAYLNYRFVLTFVGEDGKESFDNPAIYTDLDELSHKIINLSPNIFAYHKTIYFREDGKDLFTCRGSKNGN